MDQTIDYLQQNTEITEVILSGGDPLMLTNTALKSMLQRLETIEHLQRLRIHSRMPITIPGRIDPELAHLLADSRLQKVFVIHCNHANELDEEILQAITTLNQHNITLLNQSVLLRGINDNAETLHTLSEKLFSFGVLPYYLHLLDRVAGAAHFELTIEQATTVHRQLQASLSGYLVPKLVYEMAGAESKTLL